MTSRTTLTALLVVFAASTIASASCGGTDTKVPPPPKTTTSSGVTTGGDTSVTTGAGGSGGSGGAGGMGSVSSTSSTGSTGGSGGAAAATCTDMLANGKESDKDCGGPDCPPCNDNLKCNTDADCSSKKCDASGVCSAPSCIDGVKNGTETDLDCGGGCTGCGPDQTCSKSSDCKGASCINSLCAASCSDGVKNSGTKETDIDCGGGTCPTCANNHSCLVNSDCTSNICNASNICVPASCMDGIQNLAESDIDCGGATCPVCSTGQKCNGPNDCSSKMCTMNKCACPAGMRIAPKVGGGTYCIDTTEVTNGAYDVFLTAGQAIQNLPAVCAYKTMPPGYVPGVWPPQTSMTTPVSNVDWCDAYAYCAYSGKHLCGKIGGGQNVDPGNTAYADATKSEWFNACSAQGNNTYPYGNTYNNATCVGVDKGNSGAPAGACSANTCAPVLDTILPSYASCQGGVVGLAGMSGNLAEWENSCDDAMNPTTCHVRGGSRCETGSVPGGALQCAELASQPIQYQGCDVGFRCCF